MTGKKKRRGGGESLEDDLTRRGGSTRESRGEWGARKEVTMGRVKGNGE